MALRLGDTEQMLEQWGEAHGWEGRAELCVPGLGPDVRCHALEIEGLRDHGRAGHGG